MNSVIIGTRGSPLALAQVAIVRNLLLKAHPGLEIDTKIIKTSGDQFTNLSLVAGGGKGLFTKEIEDQLLRGEIHIAVHSMKDLPTMLPDGLTIGAVPAREDARDVFISRQVKSLDELPQGARVATSSVRRRAQLLARRPGLQIEEIRGNVETRLRKLAENDALDALILAAAGLKRLGLWQKSRDFQWQLLEVDVMIPAVGQGAIACEVRETDLETQELLAPVTDADTLACTEAERVFLRALGGGCQVPYAAHATISGAQMRLIGAKFSPDGRDVSRAEAIGPGSDPHEVGERAAREILQ
jgi:hydroxymethylbilane synthase